MIGDANDRRDFLLREGIYGPWHSRRGGAGPLRFLLSMLLLAIEGVFWGGVGVIVGWFVGVEFPWFKLGFALGIVAAIYSVLRRHADRAW